MLKQKESAARVAGRLSVLNGTSKANGKDELLSSSVLHANPQFKRLDGLLTGLAEGCMNESTAAQIVGVCSSIKGEGKTTIAMGLATAIARRAGAPVLLIEGDLETPTLAHDLKLPARVGLAECLSDGANWSTAVHETAVPHLSIITAGVAKGSAATLVERAELNTLVVELRSHYRHVVFDMPPILERVDASRLVELVDKVIFLIGAGKVSEDVVEAGLTAVGKDKLMGVVLNGAWNHAPEWITRLAAAAESKSHA
jgi:capsular exopolysaccharide synthesis family protein